MRISLDVEIDGRGFDVGESDPFLKTFSSIRIVQLIIFYKRFRKITFVAREFSEIAVNRFHFRRSHDGIKSVQGIANQPQILARLWQSTESRCAHELAKRMDA
jgi:hypothetical protein